MAEVQTPITSQTGDMGNASQTDPATLAAEAVRRQMSAHIAALQQQLSQQNQRIEQFETADLDETGRMQWELQKARQAAAEAQQQLQMFALQQQKAADVQRLAGMFRDIGVEVDPGELMDATDVMDAVTRAARKAKTKLPEQVAAQARQVAERDAANTVHLGAGTSFDANEALSAAKKAGDPVAALRAIFQAG
jgi:hypothetical protein